MDCMKILSFPTRLRTIDKAVFILNNARKKLERDYKSKVNFCITLWTKWASGRFNMKLNKYENQQQASENSRIYSTGSVVCTISAYTCSPLVKSARRSEGRHSHRITDSRWNIVLFKPCYPWKKFLWQVESQVQIQEIKAFIYRCSGGKQDINSNNPP